MNLDLDRSRARAARLAELEERRTRLAEEARRSTRSLERFESRAAKESQDVVEAERGGFSSLARALLGLQEDRIAREKAEALRAALVRDRARAAHASLLAEIAEVETELVGLAGAREEYARRLEASASVIQDTDTERAKELSRLHGELASIEAARAALRGAQGSLRSALTELRGVSGSLARAERLAAADSWGVPFTHGGKYEHLDEASRRLVRARAVLRRMARETGLSLPTHGLVLDVPESIRLLDRLESRRGRLDETVRMRMSDGLGQLRALERELGARSHQLETEDAEHARHAEELLARREELLRATGPG